MAKQQQIEYPHQADDGTWIYSEQQQEQIHNKVRQLRDHGKAQAGLLLRDRFKRGELIEAWEYGITNVKPEREGIIDARILEPPPHTGRNSGADKWREWMKQVSDIDPEIIDNLTRKDIVELAQERGILPPDHPKQR